MVLIGIAESSTPGQTAHEGPAGVNALDRLRILVVEDDETNRAVTLLMLDRLELHADVVGNGIEALVATRAGRYDVVLMDIQIPEMDGLETTRRIRSELPETSQPFIIAMTAGADVEDQILYLQTGMDELLPKPFHLEELAVALDNRSTSRSFGVDRVREHWAVERRSMPLPSPAPVPPMSPLGRLPLYDPSALDVLMTEVGGENGDLRRDLIEDFLRADDERCTAVTAAGRETTGSALAFMAHGLKSAGATLGLAALSETAARIEFGIRTTPERVEVAVEASELVSQCLQASAALRMVLRGGAAHSGRESQVWSFDV
jgi:CheY-like chemotaxis protein/HPt (histidine-containing phosphotransfer) domain-containing protein